MKKVSRLLMFFILISAVIVGCSSKSKYEQNNNSFKVLEDNISTGLPAKYFTRLQKTKEIEGLGNIYEMKSNKGNANVAILEDNDNVIEIDVTAGDLKNSGDWSTVAQVFAFGLSENLPEVTEKTTSEDIIKDVAGFLSNKLNEVFEDIDFKNGEKSAYKVEEMGDKRIVYTVDTNGNSISFNYLIDNRSLYEDKK